ncbi:hypothetical protein CP02DC15_0368 [Chlamydia psittaci 02DC15]|nr:hypothetical protein B600_0713 [Chlamydia psittaci VS225]EPJ12955.1 hypothetical protein CP02DC16_1081 [Chlamydia psittaci 02DC16]EPJ14586.1 hypothetical protein CP02DC15_0368 [Chlamydia psittaci 02DC15]EPJ29961.1 hypothetical protein CP03DC35_1072 [Chlamydia psittaci 03DC35]EPJ33875.1 hypothetical protein CP061683_0957 [Chlamydia psittaci 06-1683]EPP29136.1 hypothetical protein CP082626L3_0873 [Chlamydia psittaci 08-2626_L3]EPP31518.1 hypothetical protein CPC197_0771 [Chlamydia psittaci C
MSLQFTNNFFFVMVPKMPSCFGYPYVGSSGWLLFLYT